MFTARRALRSWRTGPGSPHTSSPATSKSCGRPAGSNSLATAARGSGACAADRGLRKLSSAVLRQQVDVAGVDTGRLNAALNPQAHRIVYGSNPGADAVRELRLISEVDRAHLVMLAERGIIDAAVAARLPREIQRLRGEEYAPLLEAVDALADSLLDQVLAYQDVVMPAYTHGQPAVPTTFGHYLAGATASILRGYGELLSASTELPPGCPAL